MRNIDFFKLVYILIFKLKIPFVFVQSRNQSRLFKFCLEMVFVILEIKYNCHDKVININIIITLWIIAKS